MKDGRGQEKGGAVREVKMRKKKLAEERGAARRRK
jgi:hypothetical protein